MVEQAELPSMLRAAAMAVGKPTREAAVAICEAVRAVMGVEAVSIGVKVEGAWKILGSTDATRAAREDGAEVVVRRGTSSRLIVWGQPRAPLPSLAITLCEQLAERHQREAETTSRHLDLLRRERAALEEVAALRERIRHAAHDLRTPMSVMVGYLDLLDRGLAGPLTPQMRRYFDRLTSALERQQQITRTLLGEEDCGGARGKDQLA